MSAWDPKQYLKFQAERSQPAVDLVNRIRLENPADILDVGCGPGSSAMVLRQRFPQADILGIDSSPEMIAAAKSAYPDIRFRLCDAGRELASLGQRFDIVFSNACLQWIPDHGRLLGELTALLKKGGVLAVQLPMNQEEPIHRIIADVSGRRAWREKLGTPRIFHTLEQEEYFDLLARLTADFELWQTTYFHRMESLADLLEWYRGTGLRPYLEALPPADRSRFEEEILHELAGAYPKQENGEIIFRFPRLFFLAVR